MKDIANGRWYGRWYGEYTAYNPDHAQIQPTDDIIVLVMYARSDDGQQYYTVKNILYRDELD